MHKLLSLVLCIVILRGIHATGAGISDEDIDEILGLEGWKDSEVPYHQIPEDTSGEIQKRSNSNALIRRSSLDKNFMRFGRSSFFPNNKCCKHKDMVGFVGSPNAAAITQERGPSEYRQISSRGEDNFIRFGRPSSHGYIRFGRGDKDNFMRFGRGDKDNFMRFGRGDKDNFMRFGRGDGDNFMRFGRGDGDNFMRFGRGDKDNFMRFGRGDSDNFMRFGRGDSDNFMRFGRGDKDNFMRFGRGDKDNFMRFGRDSDNFMRFGRGDSDNFMRFGRGDSDNFMRFGRGDSDNFMRFGRGDKDNFMRFGRGDKDNFMRFGRGDKDNFMRFGRDDGFMRFGKKDKENFIRFGRDSENFMRFGKGDPEEAYSNFDNFMGSGKSNPDPVRHGNQDEKDEKFTPFGRNGTSFSRLGPEDSDKEERLDSKNVLLLRRKRTVSDDKTGDKNIQTAGDLSKRSALIEENVSKPNLLKFISMINSNRPVDSTNQEQGPLSLVLRYPDVEKYKRKQDKSAFIRFG